MKPLVIYHAGCWDGFCAAWIAWRALGPDCEFVPCQYGELPPACAGRDVYILDFSFKRDVLQAIHESAALLLVLDHHKTAQADLAGLEYCRFDMSKSGARLAWEHFFPSKAAPWLVDYTEDRDLWRWSLEDSREVNAALRSYPLDFEIWDGFYRAGISSLGSLTGEGAAILRAQQQIVDGLVSHAVETEIDGHKVLMVNATCHVSEVAGELAKNRPFGVVWFEGGEGERVYSLRSDENGIDVSEIAKAHGGGGHARAAGFRVPATGATGLFTEGRMSDDDEGELQIAIGSDLQNKLVRIDFGKPTAWVAFPKEVALALSRSLASKAEQI